jgi:hypothetical protein
VLLTATGVLNVVFRLFQLATEGVIPSKLYTGINVSLDRQPHRGSASADVYRGQGEGIVMAVKVRRGLATQEVRIKSLGILDIVLDCPFSLYLIMF